MNNQEVKTEYWSEVIDSDSQNRKLFKQLFDKRDLIFLLVKRDFAKEFKQTILGPLWFIIQPIFQTIILVFIFGKIGKMGPTGIPMVSFYLGGTMLWSAFSENLLKTSETFRANVSIFSKVYFPRLVIPVSSMFTQFLKIGVQFGIFLAIYFVELSMSNSIQPNYTIFLFPFFIIVASLIGLSSGLILCSLTTKYWDLRFLIQFAIQLLMFLSAVITPVSLLETGTIKTIIMLNPISSLVEGFRYGFLGQAGGSFDLFWLGYSVLFLAFTWIFGIYLFRKVERNFIDSI